MWFLSELVHILKLENSLSDEMSELKEKAELVATGKESFTLQKMFLFDSFVSLCYAIICFSFPAQILKFTFNKPGQLDSFHKLYCRYYGAYMLFPAVMSIVAFTQSIKHQKSYIIQRAITQTLIFTIHVIGHWGLNIYSPNHITPFMISGFYITFILSIYFRVRSREEEPSNEESYAETDYDSDGGNVSNDGKKLKTN
uniref:Transmembrane protein n=1 Tax=Parastrongyloides trichosuri TaxID=131310 RepID=A0A0N4ZS36_PARTI